MGCLTSLATNDELFFSRQVMEFGMFFNRVGIKSLKFTHNPDRTELPTHSALRIAIR